MYGRQEGVPDRGNHDQDRRKNVEQGPPRKRRGLAGNFEHCRRVRKGSGNIDGRTECLSLLDVVIPDL